MEMAVEGANFEEMIQSSILDTVNLSIRRLSGGSPAMTGMVISYSPHVFLTQSRVARLSGEKHRIPS